MSNVIYPPVPIHTADLRKPTCFLAGSIEMGKARRWQLDVAQAVPEAFFFNPYREDFNPDEVFRYANPYARDQVQWERMALDFADLVFVHIEPGTQAPITLYEMGRWTDKIAVVSCPEQFWKYGNVEANCLLDRIPLRNNLEDAIEVLQQIVSQRTQTRII